MREGRTKGEKGREKQGGKAEDGRKDTKSQWQLADRREKEGRKEGREKREQWHDQREENSRDAIYVCVRVMAMTTVRERVEYGRVTRER